MLKKIFLIIGLACSTPISVEAAQTVKLASCIEKNPLEACARWLGGAVCYGHETCVRALIKQGANINEVNISGKTPLHLAIEYNRYDLARTLLENGADVSAKDGNDNTPLDVALTTQNIVLYLYPNSTVEKDRAHLVALLIDNGAEVPTGYENNQAIKDAQELVAEWDAQDKFEFRTNVAYTVGGILSVIGSSVLGHQLNKEYKKARLEVLADNNQKQISMTAKELRTATLKRGWQNIKARPWNQKKGLLGGITATGLGLGTLLATWITVKIKGY
jgi:ankyrin repeat protein